MKKDNSTKLSNASKPMLLLAFNFDNFVSGKPTDKDIVDVIMFLKDKKEITTAQLQIEFKKGYNWANKIADILEVNQLISVLDGKIPYRKVIADSSVFDSDIIILDVDKVDP